MRCSLGFAWIAVTQAFSPVPIILSPSTRRGLSNFLCEYGSIGKSFVRAKPTRITGNAGYRNLAATANPKDLEGIYTWSYSGGRFPVELRQNNVFYSKSYPALATWSIDRNFLTIDWKKYGKYIMQLKDTTANVFEGELVGSPGSWRKAEFVRAFSEEECRLVCGGSVWRWEYQGGSFEVEFHADGFNHFVCKSYPAHAHWSMQEENKVLVRWGAYGDYEMVVEPGGAAMTGHAVGAPASWRRAVFLRPLGPAGPDVDCGLAHD